MSADDLRLTANSRELAEIDHDEWTVPDAIIERLDNIDNRLDKIEKDTAEFKALAAKIWGFVEQMKDNPMLSAMLGGIPKQR